MAGDIFQVTQLSGIEEIKDFDILSLKIETTVFQDPKHNSKSFSSHFFRKRPKKNIFSSKLSRKEYFKFRSIFPLYSLYYVKIINFKIKIHWKSCFLSWKPTFETKNVDFLAKSIQKFNFSEKSGLWSGSTPVLRIQPKRYIISCSLSLRKT